MRKLNYSILRLILITLSVLLVWNWIYNQVFKPKPSETIHLFLTSDYLSTYDLEEQLLNDLSSYGIKKIIITYVAYDDPYYSTQLMTQGILSADILILPSVLLNDFTLSEQFLPINSTSLWSKGLNESEFSTLDENNHSYALSIYESGGFNHFGYTQRFDETLDYYMTINKDSIHSEELLHDILYTLIKKD